MKIIEDFVIGFCLYVIRTVISLGFKHNSHNNIRVINDSIFDIYNHLINFSPKSIHVHRKISLIIQNLNI